MKEKHLTALKAQYEKHIRNVTVPKPSLEKAVFFAIVSGEPVKIRSGEAIVKNARLRLAKDRYRETLTLEDVFEGCRTYALEMGRWKAAEKEHRKKVAAFRKVADGLIVKAEFDDEADPEEISVQLTDAARKVGLFAEGPNAY